MRYAIAHLCILLILAVTSCSDSKRPDIEQYLDLQIKDRMQFIRTCKDSLLISPARVDGEINKLVLLSKDVENITANVRVANSYFDDLTTAYGLEAKSFARVDPAMDLDEIALRLKENELGFFNQVIFKHHAGSDLKIFTAH